MNRFYKISHQNVMTVREAHRPARVDNRYPTGEEVMECLHICPRTLQTFRDNRTIGFTTVDGKILYPE